MKREEGKGHFNHDVQAAASDTDTNRIKVSGEKTKNRVKQSVSKLRRKHVDMKV